MAQAPESDRTRSSDPQLPDIRCWPNDARIVSIQDARRRLTLADGFRDDLRQLATELERLQREALEAAGMYDVEATYDSSLMRTLLAKVRPPETWGNEWMIDLIDAGQIYFNSQRFQALTRVGAYAEIPCAEVRQVADAVGAAIAAALDGRGPELLPRLQDVIEQLWSASGDYQHLRDSIAGRLDRMEAEQAAAGRIQLRGQDRGWAEYGLDHHLTRSAAPTTDPIAIGGTQSCETDMAQIEISSADDSDGGTAKDPSPPDTSGLEHVTTETTPTSGESDDEGGLPRISIQRLDRPEGFSEDLWEELASLRTLLAAADRFLNTRTARGGRSFGPTFLDGEQQEILSWLVHQPGRAVVRMHHKARDLAGNLRRDCRSIQLPNCPPLPGALASGDQDHVILAVRDAVPSLRGWLRELEALVRQWAAASRSADESGEAEKPRAGRKGRTGRPRLEDCSDPSIRARVNLYRIINSRRQEAVRRSDLAQLLDTERDVRDLAKEAGFTDGVTAETVRLAEQFARNRQKDPPAENSAT
jgi:hypothetical protein